MDVRDIARYRGEFFRVLQQTERSQTAVMTIAAGEDAGPEETHGADQIIHIVEGEAILGRGRGRAPGRRRGARRHPSGHSSSRPQSGTRAAFSRHGLRTSRILSDQEGIACDDSFGFRDWRWAPCCSPPR
jgi:hypothetical protein